MDKCREAFEKWFFGYRAELRKHNITLDSNDANSAYAGFEAAWNTRAEPKHPTPDEVKEALYVDTGINEPVRIIGLDGTTEGLYSAVKRCMFHGDTNAEQDEEVAGIVGDLKHDGEYHGEDFSLRVRKTLITAAENSNMGDAPAREDGVRSEAGFAPSTDTGLVTTSPATRSCQCVPREVVEAAIKKLKSAKEYEPIATKDVRPVCAMDITCSRINDAIALLEQNAVNQSIPEAMYGYAIRQHEDYKAAKTISQRNHHASLVGLYVFEWLEQHAEGT